MSLAAPPENVRTLSGVDLRRSTRIERPISLIILGQTPLGLSFQERTSAVSFNLHGCRYPSRHDYSVGTWIGLKVMEPDGQTTSPVVRARVRSIYPSANPRELFQIGVELESPANIWGVPEPPDDWDRIPGTNISTTRLATAVAPARESSTATAAFPAPQADGAAVPENPEIAPSVAAPPAATAAEPAKQPAPAKPERIVITVDQLVAAMQGKLHQAAEKIVQDAVAVHLDQAVRNALGQIDEACRASAKQIEELTAERLETLSRTANEQVLGQLDARLAETGARWNEQQDAYRARAEEIAQNLEKRAVDARPSMADSRKLVEGIVRELEPNMRARLEDSLGRAIEELESAAARVSDRHLVRLMEATQMTAREATAKLEARVAESRSLVQSAASSALGEFQRQAEVQVDLAVSETTERVKSSLASLDAENRAACDARRRAIESEVTRATEQSTEQFRSGIKAFLYSCLVAAVGAVDEHAQTTLNSLVKNSPQASAEIANSPGGPEKDDHAPQSCGDPPAH